MSARIYTKKVSMYRGDIIFTNPFFHTEFVAYYKKKIQAKF